MSARQPFNWVLPQYRGRLLIVLSVLVLASTTWLVWFGQVLHTEAAPNGIVSFELAGTAESAGEILQSWSPRARAVALLIQGFDSLYLVLYPAWYALAMVLLATRLGGRWARAGLLLSWLVLLAAPLDAVENYALNQQLLYGADDGYAALSLWCALPKFGLVIAGSVYLLLGLVALALRRQ